MKKSDPTKSLLKKIASGQVTPGEVKQMTSVEDLRDMVERLTTNELNFRIWVAMFLRHEPLAPQQYVLLARHNGQLYRFEYLENELVKVQVYGDVYQYCKRMGITDYSGAIIGPGRSIPQGTYAVVPNKSLKASAVPYAGQGHSGHEFIYDPQQDYDLLSQDYDQQEFEYWLDLIRGHQQGEVQMSGSKLHTLRLTFLELSDRLKQPNPYFQPEYYGLRPFN